MDVVELARTERSKGITQVGVGIIGTGWVGGVRANALRDHPQVRALHICDIRADRLKEVEDETNPDSATLDYRDFLANPDIDVIFVSTTPERTHYPITREALLAGKHVLVEKPLASTTEEADELIQLAKDNDLKLTVGYSQRFNPRMAFIRKTIRSGAIGEVVTCLVSRNVTRELGEKITRRVKLSPASMEATHDLDYLLWCLKPRKPVKVYSQTSGKLFPKKIGSPDHQWVMVTLDDGTTLTVGAGWILPLGYPNYSNAWIEVVGTDGAITQPQRGDPQHHQGRHPLSDVDHAGRGGRSRLCRGDGQRDPALRRRLRAQPAGHGHAGGSPHDHGHLYRSRPFGRAR